MQVRLRWLSAAAALGLALACSSSSTNPAAGGTGGSDAGDAGATGGTGGTTGGTGGTEAGSPDADAASPCPPDMADMGDFCIDKFEVTNSDYKTKFTDSLGATYALSAPCTYVNEQYGLGPFDNDSICQTRAKEPTEPVSCVDWCGAHQYCLAQGKRLCGRRPSGGRVVPDQHADADISEWFYACSNAGKHTYPYGESYISGRCIDSTSAAVDPGTKQNCKGMSPPFDQVFDLSGNVAEWDNTCESDNDGPNVRCMLRGGDFGVDATTDPSQLTCAGQNNDAGVTGSGLLIFRSSHDSRTGFRCCMDRPGGG